MSETKAKWSYLPKSALDEISIAWDISNSPTAEYPKGKYPKHNWRNNENISYSDCYDSLMHHLADFMEGQDKDPETQRHALAHAGCRLLMLLEISLKGTGNDDRFKA